MGGNLLIDMGNGMIIDYTVFNSNLYIKKQKLIPKWSKYIIPIEKSLIFGK